MASATLELREFALDLQHRRLGRLAVRAQVVGLQPGIGAGALVGLLLFLLTLEDGQSHLGTGTQGAGESLLRQFVSTHLGGGQAEGGRLLFEAGDVAFLLLVLLGLLLGGRRGFLGGLCCCLLGIERLGIGEEAFFLLLGQLAQIAAFDGIAQLGHLADLAVQGDFLAQVLLVGVGFAGELLGSGLPELPDLLLNVDDPSFPRSLHLLVDFPVALLEPLAGAPGIVQRSVQLLLGVERRLVGLGEIRLRLGIGIALLDRQR
ncbi:hypothetical protein [Azotobacter beijerinckii]|nr:hypothetical protein [Azotobacter beijerinckii]